MWSKINSILPFWDVVSHENTSNKTQGQILRFMIKNINNLLHHKQLSLIFNILQILLQFSFRSDWSTLVHSLQYKDKVVSAIGHIPFDCLFMKVAWLIICSNVLCITPHYITVHWIRAGFGQCKSKKCSRVRPMIDYTEYRYLPRPQSTYHTIVKYPTGCSSKYKYKGNLFFKILKMKHHEFMHANSDLIYQSVDLNSITELDQLRKTQGTWPINVVFF